VAAPHEPKAHTGSEPTIPIGGSQLGSIIRTLAITVVERMSAVRVIVAAAALGRLLAQADGDRFPDCEATLG
jgi:hypothetical protein